MINEDINKSANSFSTLPLNLDETKIMVLKKIKKILPNKINTEIIILTTIQGIKR